MRDCYVGDIGDFANNGLLRVLCGTPQEPVPDMRLGIIWYRNEGEDPRGYGNEIGYLNPSNCNRNTYRTCDCELYDALQRLVGERMARNQNRRIEDVINSPIILRTDTQHYDRPLCRPAHINSRKRWFNEAVVRTAKSDVIFLNPDKGIEWDRNRKATLQYVHTWELEQLLETCRVLVIYQHQQQQNDANWIENNARNLLGYTPVVQHLWVCTWNRVSRRAYFITAQTEEQRATLEECLATMQRIPWERHWRILYWPADGQARPM